MHSQEVSLLVTSLLTVVGCIRVDWNTNTGPIIPPTPRTTPRPVPPFREPAPVWEDQSNDIPNPKPYVYVLPPPSRPRYNNVNNNNHNNNNENLNHNQFYYGMIVPASPVTNAVNSYYQPQVDKSVAGLAPKYVPGVGIQYYAVVPSQNSVSTGAISKLQGKYNAKTKKFKAYSKQKYLNGNGFQNNNNNNNNNQQNYNEFNNKIINQQNNNNQISASTSAALTNTQKYTQTQENDHAPATYDTQELPVLQAPRSFQQTSWSTTENTKVTPFKTTWKWKKPINDFDNKYHKKHWTKSNYSSAPNALQT